MYNKAIQLWGIFGRCGDVLATTAGSRGIRPTAPWYLQPRITANNDPLE